ncbi:MAG: sensor histidine kinase [Candidatus Brocadiales bacterium]
MEPSGIISTKTFHKTDTNAIGSLPKQPLSPDDKERLIILGKGAAELAHQLNNSFDGIRRFLNLSLACADNQEKATHYILKAKGAIEKVGTMAESLLDFARKERATSIMLLTLYPMLEDILHLYENKLKAQGVKLATHCEDNNHLLLPGDFYHVFSNLIKNAIEAMPLGGLLGVRTHIKGSQVEVAISDTGIGIPNHLREELFKPFFTTKENGTGLGLALSKEIAERHGGVIYYDSKVGRGSTFIVNIPINR